MQSPSLQLYADFAQWWPLLSHPDDYAEEASSHWNVMSTGAGASQIQTILELGSGGGNNASHLKRHARMTLVDRSTAMLDVSRRLNPECEHIVGDMRDVRIGRAFDAVFVHDAVMYLTTEADLRAMIETAFSHLNPGGVFLVVPDHVTDTFEPSTTTGGHDADDRGLRYLAWTFDPDPDDQQYVMDMVYIMRGPDGVSRVAMDQHEFGLFPRETWRRMITQGGFACQELPCTYEGGQVEFVGVRQTGRL